MSADIKNHVQSIADSLSNPPWDEWNEGRDIDSEGEFSAFDYLQDVLDIEYIVASDKKTYLGARLLVAFGGPNIWINTRTKTVEGHWWADSYSETYTDSIGLDEALEELFNC